MSLFMCEKCHCVENTALSNYWFRSITNDFEMRAEPLPALCSACDPDIGQWHGVFPKRSAIGLYVDKDGFLHAAVELMSAHRPTVVAKVHTDGTVRPLTPDERREVGRTARDL